MVHHGMKTRDSKKSVVAELLKKGAGLSAAREAREEGKKSPFSAKGKPSPSDSVRKSNSKDVKLVFGPEVVGRKIAVFWDKPGKWYKGKIQNFRRQTRTHFVKYDDGDQAHLNLTREKFQWLTQASRGSAPNPSYFKSPKGKEAIGRKVKVYWPAMMKWYVGKVKDYDPGAGKHLIAYQDGEQQYVLLRNEAVQFQSKEASKSPPASPAKARVSGRKGQAEQAGKGGAARSGHRGKRVAADWRDAAEEGAAGKREAGKRQRRDQQEHSASGPPKRSSRGARRDRDAEDDHDASLSKAGQDEPAARPAGAKRRALPDAYLSGEEEANSLLVASPSTPENGVCVMADGNVQQFSHEELTRMSEEQPAASGGEGERNAASSGSPHAPADGEVRPAALDLALQKVELAKMKAAKAQEMAARKAEEAAKALAAAAAARKAASASQGAPAKSGLEAVGWRVGVWSPEEHKYLKGRIVSFDAESGAHSIEYEGGARRAGVSALVRLGDHKTKWLSKGHGAQQEAPAPPQQLAPQPAGGKDRPWGKEAVGLLVRLPRGGSLHLAEVIAFSASRQRNLALFADGRHEWLDMRKARWEAAPDARSLPAQEGARHGAAAVGSRVQVYSSSREAFLSGEVCNFNQQTGLHMVRYDDGDRTGHWLKVSAEKIKWVCKGAAGAQAPGSKQGARRDGKAARPLSEEEAARNDPEAVWFATCHPNVFSVRTQSTAQDAQPSPSTSSSQAGPAAGKAAGALGVLASIHGACGLATSLEELSCQGRAKQSGSLARSASNAPGGSARFAEADLPKPGVPAAPVPQVDDLSGLVVVRGSPEPASAGEEGSPARAGADTLSEGGKSDGGSSGASRQGLYHRLQALELMLEHSGHVEQGILHPQLSFDSWQMQQPVLCYRAAAPLEVPALGSEDGSALTDIGKGVSAWASTMT